MEHSGLRLLRWVAGAVREEWGEEEEHKRAEDHLSVAVGIRSPPLGGEPTASSPSW